MTPMRYDVLVLGLGGMGSATLYHLAKRGLHVCGIEQFGVGHDRGSSHGAARVIRKAYLEHPDYVPLLHRAYELWEELEQRSGRQLFVKSGLLLAGPPDSTTVQGLNACYREHNLPHRVMSAREAMNEYPRFSLPDDGIAFFDPEGGYLFVEDCVEAHIAQAAKLGADVRLHEEVESWHVEGDEVIVETERGTFSAPKLVITAGPWSSAVLGQFGVRLQVMRKVQLWYDSPNIEQFRGPDFPTWFVESGGEMFYGIPAIGDWGIKVAQHTGGQFVQDPNALDRSLRPEDETPVLEFLSRTFPDLAPRRTHFSVCMYTMSPDEHFILDHHPDHENVVLGCGFSGHGFKFASVVGEILCQLALDGKTRHPIDFLRLRRLLAPAAL
jgi:sarcosine oxidase